MSPSDAAADPAVEEVFDVLAGLGELRARRMFGGIGLYCDDVFFALIAEGVLYFKVDEQTVAAFEARGAAPFNPFDDPAPASIGYFEVPVEIQERRDDFLEWARDALAAAKRRDEKKKPRKKKKRAPRDSSKRPIKSLLNLGPKSSAWLTDVGILTRADLERVGSVGAYRAVVEAGHAASVLLLYALEGALLDLRWDRLSDAIKRNLRERAASSATRRRKS